MWGGLMLLTRFAGLTYGSVPFMIPYILGGLSPTISAVYWIIKKKIMRWPQVIKIVFSFKQPFLLYILAIILIALESLVPFLLGCMDIVGPLYMPILLLPTMLFGGGLEEVGWRWILQPALEKKLPFAAATLVTAAIWSVWHLPLFFIENTGQYGMSFGLFAIMVVGMSFALAVVYRLSNSVWLCVLMHSLSNSMGSWLQHDQTLLSASVTALVVIAASCTVLYLAERKNAVKPRENL
jgi:CAAX amino terminal protease family.